MGVAMGGSGWLFQYGAPDSTGAVCLAPIENHCSPPQASIT